MNMNFVDIIFVVMGICFAIFHRHLARSTAKFYDELRITHAGETFLRLGFLFVGILFAISATIDLFGLQLLQEQLWTTLAHLLFILVIVLLLFYTYKAFFRQEFEKSYDRNRDRFPDSLMARFGKQLYVRFYKVAMVIFFGLSIIAYYLFVNST